MLVVVIVLKIRITKVQRVSYTKHQTLVTKSEAIGKMVVTEGQKLYVGEKV